VAPYHVIQLEYRLLLESDPGRHRKQPITSRACPSACLYNYLIT